KPSARTVRCVCCKHSANCHRLRSRKHPLPPPSVPELCRPPEMFSLSDFHFPGFPVPPRQIQGQSPPAERPSRPSAHRKSSALLFPSPEHPQAVSSFLLRGQECPEAPDSPPFLWRSLCRHTEARRT